MEFLFALVCLSFSFSISFGLGGGVSSSFNQMHFTHEHHPALHLLWKALGIQKQTPTAELNVAAGIQMADKDSLTRVACLHRVNQVLITTPHSGNFTTHLIPA